MDDKQIAVVMPVYNKEKSVSRSIESVLAQEYENFTLIIVNDGSSDNSDAIIRQFSDPRIQYLKQKNAGVSIARNIGTQATKAELIAYIDADDEWTETHLSDLASLAEEFPSAGLFATGWWSSRDDSANKYGLKLEQSGNNRHYLLEDYTESALKNDIPVWTSAAMVRRCAIDKVGGFPAGAQHGEDHALWLAISLQYPVAVSGKKSAIYHQDNTGLASKPPSEPDACMVFIQNYVATKQGKKSAVNLSELFNKFALAHVITALLANDVKKARFFLGLASGTRLFYRKRLLLTVLCIFPEVGRKIINMWQITRGK